MTDLELHTARHQQDRQTLTLPPKFGQCPMHLLKEGIKTTCDPLYFNVNCIIKATPMPCAVPKTQKLRAAGGPWQQSGRLWGSSSATGPGFLWVYVCGPMQGC